MKMDPTMATATDLIRRLRQRHDEVEGELGYFGLCGWWSATFNGAEQKRMEASFHPAGVTAKARPLTTGRGPSRFHSATALLIALAAGLRHHPQDRDLAVRVLAEAEKRAQVEEDILGLHFVYQEMIRLHSRWRDHFLDALDLTFGACYKQVTLATAVAEAFRHQRPQDPLPMHLGFQKLAGLLEMEGSYTRAIEICREAQDQGWGGNWTWTMGRLARKRDERDYREKYISASGLGPV